MPRLRLLAVERWLGTWCQNDPLPAGSYGQGQWSENSSHVIWRVLLQRTPIQDDRWRHLAWHLVLGGARVCVLDLCKSAWGSRRQLDAGDTAAAAAAAAPYQQVRHLADVNVGFLFRFVTSILATSKLASRPGSPPTHHCNHHFAPARASIFGRFSLKLGCVIVTATAANDCSSSQRTYSNAQSSIRLITGVPFA